MDTSINTISQTVDQNENIMRDNLKQYKDRIRKEKISESESNDIMGDPPDGGWGWVVTFGAFFVNVIVDGVVYSFGVFFRELYMYFDASKSLTAWIGSVLGGSILSSGPLASVFVPIFGFRKVSISGGVLSTLGFFSSTWAPNVQTMIVLFGLLGGIGLGLIYVTSTITIGHYFKNKRALATGLALGGSGVGVVAFAPLSEYLINLYSWKGAMWILSGISFNCVAIGALFRPLRYGKQSVRSESNGELKSETDNKAAESTRDCSSIFDLSLLKRVSFLVYLISCFLCMLGFLSPFTFIPDHAMDSGMTSQQGVMFISVISVASSVARVAAGWVADMPWSDTIIINSVVVMFGGITTLFVPYYDRVELMIGYCIIFGFAVGTFVALLSIISIEILGIEKLTSAYGLVTMSMGFATFIGSPVAGALADATGNYRATFYYAGAAMFLSGALCFPLRRILKWECRKKFHMNESSNTAIDMPQRNTVECISFNELSGKC